MSRVSPEHSTLAVSLTAAAGTTPEIDWSGAAAGTIFIPTGSTITTLTYHAAPKKGGTYLPIQTAAGVAVTQTVAADKAYDMPASLVGCGAIKIVANAAGAVGISIKGGG